MPPGMPTVPDPGFLPMSEILVVTVDVTTILVLVPFGNRSLEATGGLWLSGC